MGRTREPVDILVARGKSHLSKSEILARKAAEVTPIRGDISAPDYLSESQAAEFDHYAGLLDNIGVMSELDVDCLARYVIAQENFVLYERLANETNDINIKGKYNRMARTAFDQAHRSAGALGLTPVGRQSLEKIAEQYIEDEL